MIDTIKDNAKAIAWTLLVVLLLSLWFWYSTQANKKEQKIKEAKQAVSRMESHFYDQAELNEAIDLLSLKYGINEGVLRPCLEEYFSFHDYTHPDNEGVKVEVFARRSTRQTITTLSQKYNIPANHLSDIIKDLKTSGLYVNLYDKP